MWKGLIVASALFINHCRPQSTGCYDIEESRRKVGEEWMDDDFIYRCGLKPSGIGWRVFVVGCITPGGNRLMIDQSVIEDSNKFLCLSTQGDGAYLKSDNGTLSGSREFSSASNGTASTKCYDIDGKTRKIDEEWISGNFLFLCELKPDGWGWRIFVAGCITPSGQRIMTGETGKEGSVEFTCVSSERNGGFLKRVQASVPLS